ncbi:uncharacterized protein LOC110693522 [Chenopodium quinoa]|uniref:uncharacterized protein LOC110693522 n=1 Tax=Chenopodium quinoa TaxID=63459 RepID=UPI000B77C625|nr:uncharacterized protein LOC110693522 [Chenopodium quinoa]
MASNSHLENNDPSSNPNSVYYLSNSDLTAIKLVTIVFDGSSFNDWRRSMTIALSARNKLSFVDGSLNQPAPNAQSFRIWNRCNDLVISWILNSLDAFIARSVLYLKTARQIWLDLEERFSQSSGPQLFSVQQQLSDISQSENEGIAEFFTRIKMLWDQMDGLDPLPACICTGCSCTLTQKLFKSQQNQRLIHFLMKVTDKYAHTKSTILMMNPLPTVSKAYGLLLQEETHVKLSNIKNQYNNLDNAAFSARQFSINKPQQYSRQSAEHTSSGSTNAGPRNCVYTRNKLFCDYCKMRNHTRDKCLKIHGYPSDQKAKGKRVAASVQMDDVNIDSDSGDMVNMAITKEQHKQVMQYLERKHATEQGELTGGSSSLGLAETSQLAGPFLDQINCAW